MRSRSGWPSPRERDGGCVGALAERVGPLRVHPVLGRHFVCIRDCAEYYAHPSHLQEQWDTVRNTLRLAELLDHALRKAGRP